jgi:hypothetical protein
MESLHAAPQPALLLSLQHAVQAALDAGHVGVPVFVRCVAQTAPDRDALPQALYEALAVAGSWLGAPARRVYVQESGAEATHGHPAGEITATVEYAGGQSALVSASPTPADGVPRIDLMLLGNTGALYHDGSALSPAQVVALGAPSRELPALPGALRNALEQSLLTGAAVPVMETEG